MVDFSAAIYNDPGKKVKTESSADLPKDFGAAVAIREFDRTANPLDPEPAKAQLRQYEDAIETMMAIAQEIEITDEPSNLEAVGMAAQSKKLFKRVEDLRKGIVKKPNIFVKGVNAFTKIYTAKLLSIETGLKSKIGTYAYKQEMTRRENERIAQEAAKKLQDKINAEAKKKHIEPVFVPPPVIPRRKVTRTADGSVSFSKVWTWDKEDIDFEKVPDEYKMLKETSINSAIREGKREIPGLRIFEDTQTVLRT